MSYIKNSSQVLNYGVNFIMQLLLQLEKPRYNHCNTRYIKEGGKDNIIQSFLECLYVRLFWKSVGKWLRMVLDVDMSRKLQESIVLTDLSGTKGAKIRNFITITLKPTFH